MAGRTRPPGAGDPAKVQRMYLDFFHLKEFPFSNVSDERFFFQSDIHAEALCNMLYVIQQRKGMVLISGEVGAGKTFLGNMLASRLGVAAQVVTIRHPSGSARQLLRALAGGLGISTHPDSDTLSLVQEVEQGLLKLFRRNRLAAVVLDEVQDLPDETMEEIRLLWNWELDGQRLLQIVLIGQPELRDRLRRPRWESLRQRIVLSYHLGRLTADETARYIHHRLQVVANGDSPLRFAPAALAEVHKATQGVPRLINTLCDNALLIAYAKGRHEITAEIISGVVRNMTCLALSVPPAAEEEGRQEGRRQENRATGKQAAHGARPARQPSGHGRSAVPGGDAAASPAAPPLAGGMPAVPAAPSPPRSEGTPPELLRAALLGDPSPQMARQVYAVAPVHSEAHHLAVRVLAQELLGALRAGRR